MVLFRALGWLLLAFAIAAAVQDALVWWSEGVFRLLTLGDLWVRLDYASLAATQAFVGERIASRGWQWIAMPLLGLPTVPVFVVLGLLGLWKGQPGGEGRRSGAPSAFVGGTRRPRRRRSRGLS